MNKKITSSIIISLIITGSTSFTASAISLIPAITYKKTSGIARIYYAKVKQRLSSVAITSVAAISSQTLEVKFSDSVVYTTRAIFAIKRDTTSTVGIESVTWNENKTVAQLNLNSKITEGTFNVSVTGLSNKALLGSVVGEKEKVASINFLSDSLVLTGRKNGIANGMYDIATVNYQVFNQYGEDITKTALAAGLSYYSPEFGPDGGGYISNNGELFVTLNDGIKVNDKFILTVFDSNYAVIANKTFIVSD